LKEAKMPSSEVLEVAAGLIFIYLVLSTASSGIKEFISRVFDLRAKTLEGAIRNMLMDTNSSLTSKLLANHLITSTVQQGAKPAYISSRNFAFALFDIFAPASAAQPRTMQDLKNGINSLPDARVRSTLLGLVDSAQGDLEVARQRIENWYDDTMERVSGWYKRKAQLIIFFVGLALCVVVNADTLMIVHELWNDDALRTAVLEQARARGATAEVNKQDGFDTVAYIRRVSTPPIGWSFRRGDVRGLPDSYDWISKIVGILITSVAVAMGAPFWFDLLNKIVNLRLTGNPPPDSRLASTA
jgi:hypothetical protein